MNRSTQQKDFTMRSIQLSPLCRALALTVGAVMFTGTVQAAGDKAAYNDAKTSAKATYDTASKACDSMKANAKDICVAEAKAARVKTEQTAEASYKDTPKAHEHATHEIAEADYKVAKERCDDKAGNDKDVCVKEAKAAMTKTEADAKATYKSTDAKMDASKDKMKADYKVAAEKCDAMAGDAKSQCMSAAKSKYGM